MLIKLNINKFQKYLSLIIFFGKIEYRHLDCSDYFHRRGSQFHHQTYTNHFYFSFYKLKHSGHYLHHQNGMILQTNHI